MFANRPPPNPNRSTRASVGRHDSRLLTAAAARGMRRLPVRGTAQSFMGLSGLSGSNFSTLAEPPEDRRASAPINLAGGPRRRPLSATAAAARSTEAGASAAAAGGAAAATRIWARPHTVGATETAAASGRRLAGLVLQADAAKLAASRTRLPLDSGLGAWAPRQAAWGSQPERAVATGAVKAATTNTDEPDASRMAARAWIEGARRGGTAAATAAGGKPPLADDWVERRKQAAEARRQLRAPRDTGTSLPSPEPKRAPAEAPKAAASLRRAVRKSANVRLLERPEARAGSAAAAPPARASSAGPRRGLDKYGRAAAALLDADVLLISAGAGMSADSGLAVYKDIASVPAWRKAGLTYADLCDPCWLEDVSTHGKSRHKLISRAVSDRLRVVVGPGDLLRILGLVFKHVHGNRPARRLRHHAAVDRGSLLERREEKEKERRHQPDWVCKYTSNPHHNMSARDVSDRLQTVSERR